MGGPVTGIALPVFLAMDKKEPALNPSFLAGLAALLCLLDMTVKVGLEQAVLYDPVFLKLHCSEIPNS